MVSAFPIRLGRKQMRALSLQTVFTEGPDLYEM
jgi:hypothetical protein